MLFQMHVTKSSTQIHSQQFENKMVANKIKLQ